VTSAEVAAAVVACLLVAPVAYLAGWALTDAGIRWRESREKRSAADRAGDRAENQLRMDLAEAIRTQDELARARTSSLRATKHGASRLRRAIVAHEAAILRLRVRS